MGFFDFLKKKEFEKINSLTKELESLKQDKINIENELKNTTNQNIHLAERNAILQKYEVIENAEQKAQEIIAQASQEAEKTINSAEHNSKMLQEKTKQELEKSEKTISENKEIANKLIELANKDIANSLKDFRKEIIALKQRGDKIVQNALIVSKNTIDQANKKAQEIVGEAYQMNKDIETLEKTITALKNKKNGYSDIYFIPTYTLLDVLAEDYSFTEAGKDLERARQKTKSLLENNLAGQCDYVEDNRKNIAINFVVDAFNGKVDSILTTIKSDNFGILKQKITDSYHIVNDLGMAFRNAKIRPEYLEARIEELKYAVLVMELKKMEQEEQRRIREEIREEEKARREYEKALRDSQREQEIIERTLQKARIDFEKASDSQKQKYEQILRNLEEKLREAEEKKQRALSMAQQTKAGHIYIISNIGSFGENVYKIGMTRRLEPMDRVRELGDASVPFPFDVHAMIYSENSPKLENDLHKHFMDNQLNKINPRKEFFNLQLKDIREKIESLGYEAQWTMVAAATEYKESIALTKEMKNNPKIKERWESIQIEQIENDVLEEEEIL